MSSAATTTSAGAAISPRRARRSKRTMASIRLARISTGGEAATCAVLRLQSGVIGAHPPARSEEGHRGPEIALHARLQEDLLADLEAATEEGILPRPRRGQDEARDPFRLILREHLPDGAPRRVAGEMRAGEAQAIQGGQDVGGNPPARGRDGRG